MIQKLKGKSSGFTIIEVMIVLAIAALILVVVLIAVPQLQRNQRNSARRDIAGRIKAELDNFAGNNNGNYPWASNIGGQGGTPVRSNFGTPGAVPSFFERYLQCVAGPPINCGVNINDPQTGAPVGTGMNGAATLTSTAANNSVTGIPAADAPGSIRYVTSSVCSGETLVDAADRNYALLMKLEGGATYCLDNR